MTTIGVNPMNASSATAYTISGVDAGQVGAPTPAALPSAPPAATPRPRLFPHARGSAAAPPAAPRGAA